MSPEQPETLRVLLLVTGILEELGIPYHVGGSFASSIHGVPRQTLDVDVVVAVTLDSVVRLTERLGVDFFVQAGVARTAASQHGAFNVIHLSTGIKIDFFVLNDRPFDREEFARSRPQLVQIEPERNVMVKSPEDTILRKLLWFRAGGETSDRQLSDAGGIVAAMRGSLDETYLRKWAADLGVSDLLVRLFLQG